VEVSEDRRCLSGVYGAYFELVERGRPRWRLREFSEWSELGSAEVALAGDLNARRTERDRSITRCETWQMQQGLQEEIATGRGVGGSEVWQKPRDACRIDADTTGGVGGARGSQLGVSGRQWCGTT
jgi:hypothetical protein